MAMTTPLHLIGAPSSAGAYGPGQERAPGVLRQYGLVAELEAAGRTVVDAGDVAAATYREDLEHPEAGSVDTVAAVCRAVAGAVAAALEGGAQVLVVGGDCTNGIGTVAGALESSDDVGLIYIDGDTDLNTPATGDGILDWMGVGHMLALPGAEPTLASLARRTPMLSPDAVAFVAADNSNDAEQQVIAELGLQQHTVAECLADPDAVVAALCAWSDDFDRVVIHVDIDVLDGAAFPIADNTRTIPGLSIDVLRRILAGLSRHPKFVALTLCEVNPDNARDEHAQMTTLVEVLVSALGGD